MLCITTLCPVFSMHDHDLSNFSRYGELGRNLSPKEQRDLSTRQNRTSWLLPFMAGLQLSFTTNLIFGALRLDLPHRLANPFLYRALTESQRPRAPRPESLFVWAHSEASSKLSVHKIPEPARISNIGSFVPSSQYSSVLSQRDASDYFTSSCLVQFTESTSTEPCTKCRTKLALWHMM